MKKVLFLLVVIVLAGMTAVIGGCNKKVESSYITMGTNAEFPPFEYREGKKVTGFDTEIAEKVATKMGKTLKITDMSFDGLIPALQGGKVDMIVSGMSVTEERKKNVDFSNGYYTASQVIIVKSDNNVIKGPEQLEGKKIGVQLGTTGDTEASKIKNVTVNKYNAGFAAIMDLKSGKIDAVILDYEPANNFVKQNSDIKITANNLTKEEYAIAVAKGNSELLTAVNETLKEMKANGEYDKLVEKYFKK